MSNVQIFSISATKENIRAARLAGLEKHFFSALFPDAKYTRSPRPKRPLENERVVQFVYRLYYEHLYSTTQIGAILGYKSNTAVYFLFKRRGWTIRSTKEAQAAVSKAELFKQEILRRYADGESMDAIALSMGYKSKGPVRRLLKESGVAIKWKSPEPSSEQLAEGLRLYQLGHSPKAIRAMGIPILRRHLRNAGISLRSLDEQNAAQGAMKTMQGLSPVSHSDFKRAVRRFTGIVYRHNFLLFDPRRRMRDDGWTLDHVFSLRSAFEHVQTTGDASVFWLVCHPANFQPLTRRVNSTKQASSWITLDELKRRVAEYNAIHSCPYELRWWHPYYDSLRDVFGDWHGYEI